MDFILSIGYNFSKDIKHRLYTVADSSLEGKM